MKTDVNSNSAAPPCSASVARLLVEATREAAARCKEALEPPYWDETLEHEGTYCHDCATKLFPANVDGGWIGEEDSPPHCEACAKPLDFTLTDYGVERELNAIEENGIRTDHDAYCLHRMMNAGGNPLLTDDCGDFSYRPEWKPRVQGIYERLIAEQNGQKG